MGAITIPKENIKSIECKHVVYTRSNESWDEDMCTAKLIVHTHDGQSIPVLKEYENVERPFGLVKKPFQTYKDRKEWEYLDKIQVYKSRQCKLTGAIARAQGWGDPKSQLRVLARNQYLYGADITPEVLIKESWMRKYKDSFTPNKVAVIDFETNMLEGDGKEPILGCISFKDKIYLGVLAKYAKGFVDIEREIRAALEEHLGDILKARNAKVEIEVVATPGLLCKKVIEKTHEWKPDIVTFWNMLFDMEVMIQALQAEDYDLADVFCDPSIPKKYRHFNFKVGAKVKVKADGKAQNLANYERWHVLTAPSHSQFIDAMATYYYIRKAKGKEPSYSLEYTLNKHLNRGKLYFAAGDSKAPEGSIDWHMDMQRSYKIPYACYCIFDCIGVEMLDEKTQDLQTQISVLTGYSRYCDFVSNPRVTSDKLHFYCLSIGKMAGCVSDQMEHEDDNLLLGKDEWIVTLPSHLVVDNGIPMLKEFPDIKSSIRRYVSDADIGSTYPNGEIIMNLSKETTMLELARIRGVTGSEQRLVGINLTGGVANSLELSQQLLKAPSPWELLQAYEETKLAEKAD